jgi:hypothetical protein
MLSVSELVAPGRGQLTSLARWSRVLKCRDAARRAEHIKSLHKKLKSDTQTRERGSFLI